MTSEQNESERYLFYRGVGHLNSPVTIRTNDQTLFVHRDPSNNTIAPDEDLLIDKYWYIDVRPDKSLVYQTMAIKPDHAPKSEPQLSPAADRILSD